MFVDLIIQAVIELPLMMLGWLGKNTCPKCGNRLRYLEASDRNRVQCVMCDQVWELEKGQKLRPINK